MIVKVTRRAAIYVRISHDVDGDRLGVQRQLRDCETLVERLGWEIVARHEDNSRSAYSGKRRPGYDALLDDLKNGVADAVVVWKPDRLHRRPSELEEFIDLVEAHRVEVATVAGGTVDLTTSEGRAMARVVGVFARMESEVKADRTRRKHLELAERGQAVGGTRPFGYEKGGVELRPAEAALIAEAATAVLTGESLRSICARWQRAGLPGPRGGGWSQTAVRRILTSWRIAGVRALGDRPVAPAVWPAIIDRATLEQLRAILLAPGRSRGGYGPRRYVLTGLLRCGKCGARMVARPQSGRRRTYVCTSSPDVGGCGGIRVVAEPLEQWIADLVCAHLDGPAVHDAEQRRTDDVDDVEELVAGIAAGESKLATLAEDWAADRISRPEWLAARDAVERALEQLRATLSRRQTSDGRRTLAGQGRPLLARWDGMTIDAQRAVLDAVVERITIAGATPGRNVFDHRRAAVTWRA